MMHENTSRVLNFGSLNLDFVYTVDHFVRAGETMSVKGMELFLGGKGLNQSVALSRAGLKVRHIGAVGNDGAALKQALSDNGVDTAFVYDLDMPNGQAIIQRTEDGQNGIFAFPGANHAITEAHMKSAVEACDPGDILLLQNEVNDIGSMMRLAKARGMRIVVNPSPVDAQILAAPLELADMLIVNEVEAEALCGETQPSAMLPALKARFPHAALLLTLGEAGAAFLPVNAAEPFRQAAYRVIPADTTAAGDTFTGFFLATLENTENPAEALDMAAKAAALSVSKKGAMPSIPTMEEVLAARLSRG